MSLQIDENEVRNQLQNNPLLYVVSPCNWPGQDVGTQEPPSSSHATTNFVFDLSADAERYVNRVLAVRRTIVEKGATIASSPEELERIVDNTRGRR